MRRKLLILSLLCLTFAQAHAASVVWTWDAPVIGANQSPAASYNLYQASVACPASGLPAGAVQIAHSTPLLSFTQATLPAQITCTYVTALSAVGVEGLPSATFQLDFRPPGAPSALSATASATNSPSGASAPVAVFRLKKVTQ